MIVIIPVFVTVSILNLAFTSYILYVTDFLSLYFFTASIYDEKGFTRTDIARKALKAGRPLKETKRIIELSNELDLTKEKIKELKTSSKEKRDAKLRKIELETELKTMQNLPNIHIAKKRKKDIWKV